jgi:hypothetical protein
VLSRIVIGVVIGVVGAAGAVLIGMPGTAWADPDPAPAPPNVNAFPPISPMDYSVMDGAWYAFATPDGLTCVLDRKNGGYGCSGPIPAAPGGATMVSGGAVGAPGFANTAAPVFAVAGPVKPLPPNSRLSFRQVSCGIDGAGTTLCMNSRDQTGFVLSPAGSYILGSTPPLLDRPRA